MSPTSKAGRAWIAALALLLALHAVLAWLGSAETNDDAFISFRYARNLLAGRGLTFNPGERVEGYTNFLWTVLAAAAMPLAGPIVAAKLLGLAASLGLVAAAALSGRRIEGILGWLPAVWLALDPALVRWSTRGLETSLFALLAFGAFLAATGAGERRRGRLLAGLLAGLAVMTLPEGALVLGAIVLWRPGGGGRGGLARAAETAAAAAVVLAPYAGWKLAYYGGLLPNTFYAKTGGGIFQWWRGAAYLAGGWGWPELALAVGAAAGLARIRGRDRELALAALIALALVAGVLAVGGDSLGPDRFLAPIVPFLAAAGARGFGAVAGSRRPARLLALIALGAALGHAWPLGERLRAPSPYTAAGEAARPDTRLGLCLAERAPPGASLATSIIGRVPYYSDLYTIDTLGLIDPHIARQRPPGLGTGAAGHEKSDPEYVLARRPTFILGGRRGELLAAPPAEPDWLAGLRRAVSGDPPPAGSRHLHPPYDGYDLVALDCPGTGVAVWRRRDKDGTDP